jgi:hypothetical protein
MYFHKVHSAHLNAVTKELVAPLVTARPRRCYSEQRSQRGPGTVSMKEIAAASRGPMQPVQPMPTHLCQRTGTMRSGWLRLSRRSIMHENPPSAPRMQEAGRAARSRNGRPSRASSHRALELRRLISPGGDAPGAGLRGGRAVGLKRQMTHGRRDKAKQRDRREVVPSGCLPVASSLQHLSSSHRDGQRGTGRWRPQPSAASASHPSTWTQMQRGRCSIQESRPLVRIGASHRRGDGDSPQGSRPLRKWISEPLSRAGSGEW